MNPLDCLSRKSEGEHEKWNDSIQPLRGAAERERTTREWVPGDVGSSPHFATNLIVTLKKSLNLSASSFLFEYLEETVSKVPLLFFLFFFFLAAPWRMEFLGQGSDLSHRYNLCRTCSNTRSFNPLCRAGDPTNILALQRHCRSHDATVGTLVPLFLTTDDKQQRTMAMPATGQGFSRFKVTE